MEEGEREREKDRERERGSSEGWLSEFLCRYLLKFGTVTQYVGYNALSDFFPSWAMKPNPLCDNQDCRRRQADYQV